MFFSRRRKARHREQQASTESELNDGIRDTPPDTAPQSVEDVPGSEPEQ